MQPFRSWRLGRRPAVIGRAIILLLAVTVYSAAAENRGKGGKRGKGAKKNQATPNASLSPGDTGQNLTAIPLPIGHEAKGLTLPDFDTEGRLRGNTPFFVRSETQHSKSDFRGWWSQR